jgi:hypothetical protein
MYSIGNIIYGVYWTEELGKKVDEAMEQNPELADEYSTDDITTLGFESAYHGSYNGYVGWVGKSYTEIDECDNVSLTNLMAELETKKSQFKSDYEKCLEGVPEFVKNLLGEPDLFIVWSTS